MLNLFSLTILIALSIIKSYFIRSGDNTNVTLHNFAFGSCYLGFLSSRYDIFKTILTTDPQLWIWLGDAVYLDSFNLNYFKQSEDYDPSLATELYSKVHQDEFYSKLNHSTPTLGIWDDHDYAFNDANGYYKDKEISKEHFLNFLDEPSDSIRRTFGRGIYTTYSFGDGHRTARFVLLDLRFNKTSYILDKDYDMLGEEQWTWLEDVLKNNNETFTFIGSPTQLLPIDRMLTEAWYPNSRRRLIELLGRLRKEGVVLLSGDIHCGQILKTFCVLPEIGYHMYEITSSGLSPTCGLKYLTDYILPNAYDHSKLVDLNNFGKIDFIWGDSASISKISVKIYDINGDYIEEVITRKNLTRDETHSDLSCANKIFRRIKSLEEYVDYYTSYPHKLIPLIIALGCLYLVLLLLKKLFKILFLLCKLTVKRILKRKTE